MIRWHELTKPAKALAAGAVVGVTWLLLLPAVARLPAEKDAWEALQTGGIDPSAMYYTELEMMAPILQRLNAGQSLSQAGGCFKTTDGGKTWKNVYKHSMTHGGNQLYRAKDGTLYSGGYQYPARSTDNGDSWEQIKKGLTYSWYMSIIGDGEHIYTASSSKGQPFFASPESDGQSWKPMNDQKFSAVPFTMALDPVNRILYSASWEEGLLAVKLEEKK